jgi:hypothetical protein
MPRLLSPIIVGERESLRQLVAADPASLATLAIQLKANQGILRFGTFMTVDGDRALTSTQAQECSHLASIATFGRTATSRPFIPMVGSILKPSWMLTLR